MDWRDQGTLLWVRPHGETSAIVEVFTDGHGRHAGVVRGGISRRIAPVLQPGAEIAVAWRARLEDHIGAFVVEPVRSRSALLSDRRGLAALNSVCALLRAALPEREPHPALRADTRATLDALDDPGWEATYLAWEVLLLRELGFGLDLSACAVTGATDDLAFVSPRTGRAVSRAGAGDWADRLLPLPTALAGAGLPLTADDLGQGLAITGHFLGRELAPVLGDRGLPEARARLVGMLVREARPAG